MAYTEYGGSLIYIEAMQSSYYKSSQGVGGASLMIRYVFEVHLMKIINNLVDTRNGLRTTGSLGKVMQESMQIAYTFARSFAHDRLKNNYLETNEIHIHAPEGAVPKDGPSAGITITSALISLAIKYPIRPGVAMTGEISLRGKVLKIGGVKEKVLAAVRENMNELIFPKSNEDDVGELSDDIKGNLKFHFVREYEEVFALLFPNHKL